MKMKRKCGNKSVGLKLKSETKARGKGNPSKKDSPSKTKSLKGQWNLVPIGEEFFSNKDFENLVSFEELVDYNVVTKPDGTKEIFSDETTNNYAQSRKRKITENDNETNTEEKSNTDVGDDISGQENTNNIKKQKKKNSKKQLPSQEGNNEVTEIINTSAGLVVVEEDSDVQCVTKQFKQTNDKAQIPSKTTSKLKAVKDGKLKKSKSSTIQPRVEKQKRLDPNNDDKGKVDDCESSDDFDMAEWIQLGVPDIIIKALREKNFTKPTTIQTMSLPAAILGKKDVVGAAETGSGKTLAFAIPIIAGILKYRKNCEELNYNEEVKEQLKALILTPTRELAVQIKNHVDAAAKYANIKTVVIVGGLATQKQERLLRGRPDIVIATPGRLWELIQEGDEHLSGLNEIKYLAVDETDRMVEKGHFQELTNILGAVNSNEDCKEMRQNFVFSATLSFTHEPPQRLKAMGNKRIKFQPKKISSKDKLKQIMDMIGVRANPKIVDITTSKGTCETLIEMQLTCSLNHKDYYLYYFFLRHPGRTIVFCNSINCVRRLTNLFFLLEFGEVLPLHSEIHQKQRLRNLERFSSNEKGILIATDVAARGLDIQNIEHVIHYQVPKTAESYIHRSGRTARAFQGGVAILMIEPSETTTVKNIFRSLGRDEMLPDFSVDDKIFRELKGTVETAVRVEQFEHSVRKKLADHNWMEKAKKDMDLATSSEESDDDGCEGTSQKKSLVQAKKKLDNYKKQLSQLVVSNIKLTLK